MKAITSNSLGKRILANALGRAITTPTVVIPPAPTDGTIPFTTTPNSYRVSAGVFDSSNRFVRTLLGNQVYADGSHSVVWDKKDNEGAAVSPGTYTAKVLKTSAEMAWLGTIFNNSQDDTGGSKYHGSQFCGMVCFANGNIIAFHSYCENNYLADLTTTANIHRKTSLGALSDGTNFHAVGDGNIAFCIGSYNYTDYFIWGVNSDGTFATFANGTGNINNKDTLCNVAGGYTMAVQQAGQGGDYIFISVPTSNKIKVFSKTGTFIRDNAIDPTGFTSWNIHCDNTNGIWIDNKKFIVNLDGSFSATGITVSGVTTIGYAAISPDNTIISFMDVSLASQQVKSFYNTTGGGNIAGTPAWTLGQPGGYVPTNIVSNDRFAFTYIQYVGTTLAVPYISYGVDGSLWVGDSYTYRNMHFSPSRVYLDQIAFIPFAYNSFVDVNSPTNFYQGFLKATLDYSNDNVKANWVLTNNYVQQISSQVETFEGFGMVTTLANNRTYGVLRNQGDTGSTANQIVDLTDSVVRYTGVGFPWQSSMGTDGAITNRAIEGSFRQAVTGFTSNNPVYGSAFSYTYGSVQNLDSLPTQNKPMCILSNGDMVTFNTTNSDGYHIGITGHLQAPFRVLTAKSVGKTYYGPYIKDGSFNNGTSSNEYCGGSLSAANDIIYWNMHNEFWESNGQTSFHHLADKDGLPIGVWGDYQSASHNLGECYAWNSGNAIKTQIVYHNNFYYIFYGDESRHGGTHVAKIDINNTNLFYETHLVTV